MNAFIESTSGSRAAKKAATRQRILAAARVAFERDGFDGANVRAIATRARVAAGTVLLHFTDKRDLMHAALFDDLAAVIEQATRPAKRANLESNLRAIVRPFFDYYAARPKLTRELLREALLADSPWRERFAQQVARVHLHVTRLVGHARDAGEIDRAVKPPVTAAALLAFYYFALIGWAQGGLADPAPLFDQMLAEHLRGLVKSTPDKERKHR